MKRIALAVFIVLLFSGIVCAEDSYAPFTIYDLILSASGTTTARDQTGTYSGVSWFPVTIDLNQAKPNLAIFSIQPYQITLAKSNSSGTNLTTLNSSGATYFLYYTVSNKDSENLWAKAGVTPIGVATQLSGSTTVVQGFYPEFAQFMRIGILSGMTQFNNFKATLAIQ